MEAPDVAVRHVKGLTALLAQLELRQALERKSQCFKAWDWDNSYSQTIGRALLAMTGLQMLGEVVINIHGILDTGVVLRRALP